MMYHNNINMSCSTLPHVADSVRNSLPHEVADCLFDPLPHGLGAYCVLDSQHIDLDAVVVCILL